jgi:vitamin-K-epoxide reductase (warfarin-sensitive)
VKAVSAVLAILALSGAVVSGLALRVHYSTATEPCSINEHWDCGIVNHSSFAEVCHCPVALLGIGGYLAIGGLALAKMRLPLFLTSATGFLFAFRLSMIEEFALGVWCLYCVISQAIIAVILLLSLGWFLTKYMDMRRQLGAHGLG